MVVPEAGDGCWCQAQRCSAIFSVLSCRSLRDLYFVLYDMNETRITMQKKVMEMMRLSALFDLIRRNNSATQTEYACNFDGFGRKTSATALENPTILGRLNNT